MCRIAAWIGDLRPLEEIIVAPEHSLLQQSLHATEAKLAVNGDGFGVAWYRDGEERAGLYRDVLPAWADENLTNLCRMVHSGLFIAHVRASTVGETARVNCHPFAYGRWSFCHNGQVPHITRIRRGLEARLSDDLYNARRGATDSELMFLTLLSEGLEHDPAGALSRTLDAMAPEPAEAAVRATTVFSDGQTLYALRFASDGRCPTLYLAETAQGVCLASEPLGLDADWVEVPPGKLLVVTRTGSTFTPLPVSKLAA